MGSSSLVTLFHMEPQPRQRKIVVQLPLPNYGWPDQTRPAESSFRQTIQATHTSDRGFGISIDKTSQKVLVRFDHTRVDLRHSPWLESVDERIGLAPLTPQPYWDFQELFLKASTKLLNAFYVEAEARRTPEGESFGIVSLQPLQGFDILRFVTAFDRGAGLVDFDARTHHNHGAKFRLKQDWIPRLYLYSDAVQLSAS